MDDSVMPTEPSAAAAARLVTNVLQTSQTAPPGSAPGVGLGNGNADVTGLSAHASSQFSPSTLPGASGAAATPITPERESRAYETAIYVLGTVGGRLLEAGLVNDGALSRALSTASAHIEMRLFSAQAMQLFELLAARLTDEELVSSVFTCIYFLGFLNVDLASSLPNYKTTYIPLGQRIFQQLFKAAIGDEAFYENLSCNVEVCRTLASTAGLLRPTDLHYQIFPDFASFAPSRYSSKHFSDKRHNREVLEKFIRHVELCGFPQPLLGRDVGPVREWRFLSSDTNTQKYEVEHADLFLGEHFGRVLYWLICSAHRMPAGLAVIAYYDQHISLLRYFGSRFGYCVLSAASDLNLSGHHQAMPQKVRSVFDTWLIVMPSESLLAKRRDASSQAGQIEQALRPLPTTSPSASAAAWHSSARPWASSQSATPSPVPNEVDPTRRALRRDEATTSPSLLDNRQEREASIGLQPPTPSLASTANLRSSTQQLEQSTCQLPTGISNWSSQQPSLHMPEGPSGEIGRRQSFQSQVSHDCQQSPQLATPHISQVKATATTGHVSNSEDPNSNMMTTNPLSRKDLPNSASLPNEKSHEQGRWSAASFQQPASEATAGKQTVDAAAAVFQQNVKPQVADFFNTSDCLQSDLHQQRHAVIVEMIMTRVVQPLRVLDPQTLDNKTGEIRDVLIQEAQTVLVRLETASQKAVALSENHVPLTSNAVSPRVSVVTSNESNPDRQYSRKLDSERYKHQRRSEGASSTLNYATSETAPSPDSEAQPKKNIELPENSLIELSAVPADSTAPAIPQSISELPASLPRFGVEGDEGAVYSQSASRPSCKTPSDCSSISSVISSTPAVTRTVSPPTARASMVVRRKAPPPPKRFPTAVALYDFDPADPDAGELAFKEGEVLEIVEKSSDLQEDGWCRARVKGHRRVGLAPLEYLEDQQDSRGLIPGSESKYGTSMTSVPEVALQGKASPLGSPLPQMSAGFSLPYSRQQADVQNHGSLPDTASQHPPPLSDPESLLKLRNTHDNVLGTTGQPVENHFAAQASASFPQAKPYSILISAPLERAASIDRSDSSTRHVASEEGASIGGEESTSIRSVPDFTASNASLASGPKDQLGGTSGDKPPPVVTPATGTQMTGDPNQILSVESLDATNERQSEHAASRLAHSSAGDISASAPWTGHAIGRYDSSGLSNGPKKH